MSVMEPHFATISPSLRELLVFVSLKKVPLRYIFTKEGHRYLDCPPQYNSTALCTCLRVLTFFPRQTRQPPSFSLISRPRLHTMSLRKVTLINQNWQFRRGDEADEAFLPVSRFPTQVHLDLLHHKKIPDFNIGKNELDVQWVGEVEWIYSTSFTTPKLQEGERAALVFEGLDTFATVKLNGQTVLETENMFTPERVEIRDQLKVEGEENSLVIHFASASERGQQLVDQHPEHTWVCANGDVSRLLVRKAQYHWVSHFPVYVQSRHDV